MRAPRIPLSGVTRGSRTHNVSQRTISTHSQPAPLPAVYLQDVVNQALKPQFLSSTLLAPAPISKHHQPVKHRALQPPAASAPNKVSVGASTAKTNHVDNVTAGSKIYNNRAMMVIRLIRLNRILSAMAAFFEDIANPNRTAFSPKELEQFVTAMRIQCKKHASTRPAPKLTDAAPQEDLWRPSRLDPSVSARSLSISAQSMYAMAAIYDVCLERNYRPTAKMVSAMLSTFADHLSSDQLQQAADLALNCLVPCSATDAAPYLRAINHAALSSFISTYGHTGKPELGEALLVRWAKAQASPESFEQASLLHADQVINLTGWGHNVLIWQALITARIEATDIDGARQWLDRYRAATRHVQRNSSFSRSMPCSAADPAPYLAYLSGVRDAAKHAVKPGRMQRLIAHVRDTVRLMVSDHVPVESSVLAFVLDFETKIGNVAGGASVVNELSSFIETNALDDADLLRALFQLRRAIADSEAAGPVRADGTAFSANVLKSEKIPSTRSLIRSLVRVGEGEWTTSTDNLASCRSRGTLNAALLAAMAERDYPAAVVLLNLFERWRVQPSHTTYSIVLNAIVAEGQHRAFFAEPGEVTDSSSKFNLEATLQSMAREGNGEQAEAIRRAMGDQLLEVEGFVVSARPSAVLRQTQYLVRILNKACAAEIENVDSEHVAPAWWASKRNVQKAMQTGGSLPKEAVQKRVRTTIYAAQDELLGKKQDRKQGIKLTPKSPLFQSAPTLSPRRWGLSSASKSFTSRKESGRAFSTSALTRQDSGASCDLAAAAKSDLTHLDPVRTIYIPGFVPYQLGLALQEHLVKQRADARAALRAMADTTSSSAATLAGLSTIEPSASEVEVRRQAAQDTLLLLQHRPVYTEGRRHDAENELVSNHLRALGADYHLTKRGGQITYHGPGQLVGYPILNLGAMGLASRCYVDRIQDSLISLLAERGVGTVAPPDDHTGVWADEYHKIASIGIQVRHRISSHGFALNVERRAMHGFKHIVACGIVGRSMTCLQDRLNPDGPFAKFNTEPTTGKKADVNEKVPSVAQAYLTHFAKVFGRQTRPATEDEFQFALRNESHAATLKERLHIDVEPHERVVSAIIVDGRPVVAA